MILTDRRVSKFTCKNGWVHYLKTEFEQSNIEPFENVDEFQDYLDCSNVAVTVIEKTENGLKIENFPIDEYEAEQIPFTESAMWTEATDTDGSPVVHLVLFK